MTSVLLVINEPVTAAGLRAIFNDDPGFDIAAEDNQVSAATTRLSGSGLPDVVVIDARELTAELFECLTRLTTIHTHTPVLLLAPQGAARTITRIFATGVRGYLTKPVSTSLITGAAETLHRGAIVLSPEVGNQLLLDLYEPARPESLDMLTHQEHRVLDDREMRVLVATPDVVTARWLVADIRRHGHRAIEVISAATVVELYQDVDLLVLDLDTPRLHGLDLCRFIRAHHRIPIIAFVRERTEETVLQALGTGIDAILEWPSPPADELVARAEALVRRHWTDECGTAPLVRGPLTLVPPAREAWLSSQQLNLTSHEFDLLEYLARNSGTAVSRGQLMVEVWKAPSGHLRKSERTIDTHVSMLRRKLNSPDVSISSVRGVGYRLEVLGSTGPAPPFMR